MEEMHPNPQFMRKNWQSLNGSWDFSFDDKDQGIQEEWYEGIPEGLTIEVPFSYETELSGIHDTDQHPIVWYQKIINVTENKPIIIHFEGSDYETTLYVNGKKVGEHCGGYTAFEFDLTNFVKTGENQLVVRVKDSIDCDQPRGKQRWLKDNFGCWYIQTTGIWKTVWLEYVEEKHIEYAKLTPSYDEKLILIELETNCSNEETTYQIDAEISFCGKFINRVSAKVIGGRVELQASVLEGSDPWSMRSWSPDAPNLYDISFELSTADGVIDQVSSYFGMRKISIERGKVLLNNQELYQRLILDQGYWEESDLTPPSTEALELDVDKILEMGYNGVRKHQKVEDKRFLYLADKKGLLVWLEVGSTYAFNDSAVKNFTFEWLEIVKQNYNHPSVITWVPFNESWGINQIFNNKKQQAFTEGIYHLTKSFDSMRPVITNDGWEHTISDIITLHDYEEVGAVLNNRYKDKEHLLSNDIQHNKDWYPFAKGHSYKGQPVIISEFGGIAFSSEEGWGYGNQVKTTGEFMDRFESIHAAIQELDYIVGFCYTQLTDVQQEVNGLLTIQREAKVDLKKVRDINLKRLK